MKKASGRILLHLVILLIVITSCDSTGLVRDKKLLMDIDSRFKQVSIIAENRSDELLNVFSDSTLGRDEIEGLKFYLASMPLSDLADYNSDFFLANIRKSIQARNYFPWASDIPDHIFLHYVLPVRVNNENLDSFRIKYYDELAGRLKDFDDIEKAALEINHWCHEKVSYQASDIRTSSPLATILSARGRCGEESTFTVSALRTAGIPARQVYVPRWAHSDDNHAWVEVWVDGKWKYMGACEPEPVINRGWFTEAASRSMLIHTKSFGKYYGAENLVRQYKHYSEINNLGMYAITKDLKVKVIDMDNKPVEGAEVQFGLYNYAEFYPIAETITGSSGSTSFTSGLGNLLVWCSKKGDYGFKLVSAAETDSLTVTIGMGPDKGNLFKYRLRAPDPSKNNPEVSEDQVVSNKLRLKKEDSIRSSYINSWIDKEGIRDVAERSGYEFDEIYEPITRSMGNYKAIISFLDTVDINSREDALAMLNTMVNKDLRDTPAEILLDHINNVRRFYTDKYQRDIFYDYVLNPRIANEIITPWREYIQGLIHYDTVDSFKMNPGRIAGWIDSRVKVDSERNYYKVPVSPRGSLELGLSDHHSRNILFVAVCRSVGIASRLDAGRDVPQYFNEGKWFDISFKDQKRNNNCFAELSLAVEGKGKEAEYYNDFTISHISGGKYKTLNYEYSKSINDFKWPIRIDPGKYMLVSGNRLDDIDILSEILFFELDSAESRKIIFSLPTEVMQRPVISAINSDYRIYNGEKYVPLSPVNGKGMLIAWINHESEPTKHFLRELADKSDDLDKWGGRIMLVTDSTYITESWNLNADRELPGICSFAFESSFRILRDIFPEPDPINISLPLVIFLNPENEVVFKSEGYRIGLVEQVLAIID